MKHSAYEFLHLMFQNQKPPSGLRVSDAFFNVLLDEMEGIWRHKPSSCCPKCDRQRPSSIDLELGYGRLKIAAPNYGGGTLSDEDIKQIKEAFRSGRKSAQDEIRGGPHER
jgi:hypothetical protein